MFALFTALALVLLGILLVTAKLIWVRWRLPRRLFVPSSIIGGCIALLLGPDVLGRIAPLLGAGMLGNGLFGADVVAVWRLLPELLITVVFAGLFLGRRLPRIADAARIAGPQVTFGFMQCAGQYVVGLLLAILVLGPVFQLPAMSGVLIEVGFEGGHGTAAGLGDTFARAGFAEGHDLAVGMATFGLVSSIIIGIALINWGVRKGETAELYVGGTRHVNQQMGRVEGGQGGLGAMWRVPRASIAPFLLHVLFIGIAILIGQGMLSGLRALERAVWIDSVELFAYIPLFPLAMIGGIALRFVLDRVSPRDLVDQETTLRIQGFTLEVLIIAALGSLSLSVLATNIVPFLILAVAGLIWCVGSFLLLGPRMLPSYWFERGIGNLGQTLGTSATGLLLMRIADPGLKTPAFEAFGYKQLAVQPFFGGGLITAIQIPLILQYGPNVLLLASTALLAVTLLLGLLVFGRMRPGADERSRSESAAT
ncbi:ESS family glutamate:Na+ symporter [Murinocardiopsis flavida]|uniref:ESS family glutamate:Na+ symporter n=1 Tax=Murinocardiopsis flavida TaxID=645275 RepID=A0A2P8DKH3_9ACTN|nr:sodium:glutamate symporter [Murinocardiopsis flavida]PSK97725.1 ESS family glutamate:Na+ symporter [Murinocardiopsis flavida]